MSNDVRVRITGDATGVKKAAREANQSLAGLADGAAKLAAPLQSVFAGVSAGVFAGKLIAVQREFDVLNASLVTVTGSGAAAAREFEWIKEFAATPPFDLAQVTDAFIKMKAFGLDASEAALRSYGNTASAMGKDLNQMIEAVADAATGEFERLKEFGIKSSKEGDRVTFTFRGVSTTIRNSSEEITRYLKNIGDQDFAGAMAERAKTLDGALSNLGDSWNELFRTINEAGVGQAILDATNLASQGLTNLAKNFAIFGQYLNPQGQMRVDTLVAERESLRGDLAGLQGRRGDVAATARTDIERRIAAINAEIDQLQNEWIRQNNPPNNPPNISTTSGSGSGSGGGTSGGKGGRKAAEYDPLAESAKAYESALNSLVAAQATATTSGLNLSSTQQQLMQVMMSPEWLRMPEAWRVTIAAQGEAAIAAEDLANQQKRLADLLGTTELEKQRADMQLLAAAYLEGAISADEYAEAAQRALGNIKPATDDAKNQFEELKKAIEGWGKESADAIVDFALTGKSSFSDMVDSMLADLARMLVYRNITEPLASAVGGMDWGSIGASVAGFFGFAQGGVMTSAGPLPLRAYSAGGVANSPQLALYGEGSRPEAYVPLPDGRSIPVTMTGGGGGGVSIVVNNNAGPDTRANAVATTDATGNTQVMVLVEKIEGMMGRRIGQGGGLAPMLEGRYGLNPAAGARR